jgi:hypothetical protein
MYIGLRRNKMKSFQEYFNLSEGMYDPSIFKAVFLAGGPGSGKSFIVGKTGLTSLGFKVVNSDDAFEKAMKKVGMEPSPQNIESPAGQNLRAKAKKFTGNKQETYVHGRLGLVIDGTGRDAKKIKKQAGDLKKLGYDVAMIFVNTDLETAQRRNLERKRSLDSKRVETAWTDVQKNIGLFQSYFGKKHFTVVDNSDNMDSEKESTRAYREVSKFAKQKPENSIAINWINAEKDALKRHKSNEKTNPKIIRKPGT